MKYVEKSGINGGSGARVGRGRSLTVVPFSPRRGGKDSMCTSSVSWKGGTLPEGRLCWSIFLLGEEGQNPRLYSSYTETHQFCEVSHPQSPFCSGVTGSGVGTPEFSVCMLSLLLVVPTRPKSSLGPTWRILKVERFPGGTPPTEKTGCLGLLFSFGTDAFCFAEYEGVYSNKKGGRTGNIVSFGFIRDRLCGLAGV